MGGSGGSNATGGSAEVTHSGTIVTTGQEAHAVVAQSVGGGGGTFLMNPSNNQQASATQDEDTVSEATLRALLKAAGIDNIPSLSSFTAEQILSLASARLTLGGSGGVSGNGGAVRVMYAGDIATHGDAAFGILTQSIGGGGGIANALTNAGDGPYILRYGGTGGTSGAGGDVRVEFTSNSSIATSGANASAVFAQSIGGGGGYGGAAILRGDATPVIGSPTGNTSGNGGNVSIVHFSGKGLVDISTTGADAHGVFAQSLGGGGGVAGQPFATTATVKTSLQQLSGVLRDLVATSGGSGTLADNMSQIPAALHGYARMLGSDTDTLSSVVTKLDTLTTSRDAPNSTGGTVSVTLYGNVKATGPGSYGIFAQSGYQTLDGSLDPSVAGGNISIRHYSGELTGGSGDGAAIGIDGGHNNSVQIDRKSTVSARSGTAIRSSFGQESVTNFGTVTGNIDFSVGNTTEYNSFHNTDNGVYISGQNGFIRLSGDGGSGTFNNRGTFNIAGTGVLGEVTVRNGTLALAGSLPVDVRSAVDGTPSSDRLTADKVTLTATSIRPNAVDSLLPGSFTLISASNLWIVDQKPTVTGAGGSPFTWSFAATDQVLTISPSANFLASVPGTVTQTESRVLNTLQKTWDTSNGKAGGIFALLANLSTPEQYRTAVDSLATSEAQGQLAVNQMLDARFSMNAAMSCPSFEGNSMLLRESQCTWARVTGSQIRQTDSHRGEGFSESSLSYRTGAQWNIAPGLFLGATAAYNTTSLDASDGLAATTGRGADMAIALKRQIGPWLFAGSLHGGYGHYDSRNLFIFGNTIWRATDDNDVWTGGARLRAAYDIAFENWYLRPYADLDVLHTYMTKYDYQDVGISLETDALRQWTASVQPALEVGARFNVTENSWLRLYGMFGGTFMSRDGLDTEVRLSDGISSAISFVSISNTPDTLLDLGAGLQFMSSEKYEFRADYKAQMAKDFMGQELSLRVSTRF